MILNELIEELEIGWRRVAGTDWPVVDQLRRTGRREWTVIRELCNGAPRAATIYRSETQAREAFGSRLDGRKPRAGSPTTERVTVRLTATEHAAWQAAATVAGVTVPEWIRSVADEALVR